MNKIQIGDPFIVLQEVESTNDYAMQKISRGEASEGIAWHAVYQSKGKGQRGKPWLAAPGDNINLSIVLCPQLPPNKTFVLNAVIALGVYDFYRAFTEEKVNIKWSNDIYLKNKKGAGILIENIIRGIQWKFAVVGIGLNLNQKSFDKRLPHAVSLRQVTDNTWDAVAMAQKLCDRIETRYNTLDKVTAEAIIREYESHLFRLDERAFFQREGKTFEATIRGVKKEGQLLLEDQKGITKEVNFGDIQYVI